MTQRKQITKRIAPIGLVGKARRRAMLGKKIAIHRHPSAPALVDRRRVDLPVALDRRRGAPGILETIVPIPHISNILHLLSSNIFHDGRAILNPMDQNDPPLRVTFAENLARLMAADKDLNSPRKLAKKATWPTANKSGGALIAPRTIGYALKPEEDSPSPAIDFVEAMAVALRVRPWEFFVSPEEREILYRLFPKLDPKLPPKLTLVSGEKGRKRASD